MPKFLTVVMSLAITLAIPVSVWANSGPVYWQGYPSSDVVAVQKDSPLAVESENLLFDFSSADGSFYTLEAQVTATYEMFNPTDQPQTSTMAFPFVGTWESLWSKDIKITADGQELPYNVYFGDTVGKSGSSFQKDDALRLDFASILNGINPNPYQAQNFSLKEKGKLYRIAINPPVKQQVEIEIDFTLNANKTRVLTKGFNSYSYQADEKMVTIGSRCYKPEVLEILVLGEDPSFNIKCSSSTYQTTVQEVDLKSYLLEYATKIFPDYSNYSKAVFDEPSFEDQLYNLLAKSLDQGFTQNQGFCSEDTMMGALHVNRTITLVYSVDFPAGSKRQVSVSYRTTATMDRTKTVNPLYTFEYFLNPAENWSSFKNLDIKIITPEKAPYIVASNIELLAEGKQTYTAALESLPESDFYFTLYEAEEITLIDKAHGYINLRFGYLTPLVPWLILALFIVGIIILRKRIKKE
ncbi:MAG: hypothetical protein GX207_02745 [Peptococcaceae bacterium]|nr:hypothetical protein [Peptococcaceae bacterium]